MTIKSRLAPLLFASSCLFSAVTYAQVASNQSPERDVSFETYVESLKQQAAEKGYSKQLIDSAFSKVKYHKRAVAADRSQPESVETLETYLPKRVPDWKVEKAQQMLEKHGDELRKIGKEFGVQPRFIISLWALESNFGKIQGNYNVVSALATLAYDGRRETFFKSQLFDALEILKQGHIDIEDMNGSWAGAMGHNQFMPSSFLAYAADGDKDGRKDIWNNTSDVFASIANYLKKVGWNSDITWARQVQLPEDFDYSLAIPQRTGGRKPWLKQWAKTEMKLSKWQQVGVRKFDGSDLPRVDIDAALVFPDGEEGRAYLAYDNYKSLMHWNLSYYFVTSVGHLADRIKFEQ